MEYCNRKYNFNELFKDAINSDLIYIMFEVTKNNPEGKWKVNTGADYMNQRVGLRSKNGYTRAEDRLGLQP